MVTRRWDEGVVAATEGGGEGDLLLVAALGSPDNDEAGEVGKP